MLRVFQKKSKRGITTPKKELELVASLVEEFDLARFSRGRGLLFLGNILPSQDLLYVF